MEENLKNKNSEKLKSAIGGRSRAKPKRRYFEGEALTQGGHNPPTKPTNRPTHRPTVVVRRVVVGGFCRCFRVFSRALMLRALVAETAATSKVGVLQNPGDSCAMREGLSLLTCSQLLWFDVLQIRAVKQRPLNAYEGLSSLGPARNLQGWGAANPGSHAHNARRLLVADLPSNPKV